MDYESKGPTPTLLRNAGFVIGQYMDSLEARGCECEIEYGTARKVRDALYDCAKHLESKSKDLAAEAEAYSYRWVRVESFAHRGGVWVMVQHQDDGETLLAFDGARVSDEHVVEWGPWVRPPRNTECKSVDEDDSYDSEILRRIEGMFGTIGEDLIDGIERLRNAECRSNDEARRLVAQALARCGADEVGALLQEAIRAMDSQSMNRGDDAK